jgi:hypothetical protein
LPPVDVQGNRNQPIPGPRGPKGALPFQKSGEQQTAIADLLTQDAVLLLEVLDDLARGGSPAREHRKIGAARSPGRSVDLVERLVDRVPEAPSSLGSRKLPKLSGNFYPSATVDASGPAVAGALEARARPGGRSRSAWRSPL